MSSQINIRTRAGNEQREQEGHGPGGHQHWTSHVVFSCDRYSLHEVHSQGTTINIATCKASTMAFNILNGRMLSQHLVMSHPSLFPLVSFSLVYRSWLHLP